MDIDQWQYANDLNRLSGQPEHPYPGPHAPFPDTVPAAAPPQPHATEPAAEPAAHDAGHLSEHDRVLADEGTDSQVAEAPAEKTPVTPAADGPAKAPAAARKPTRSRKATS